MNPGGPSGAAGPPTSFKTNVNRAKTKRWVEAKSYSYDGDDWGEVDDYDEYGGYEPGPAKPTGLRQQGQSASPMAGALQSQPQILESPVEAHEQQYIAPGGRPSKLQQEFGGQSAISSQLYQRPNQAKTNSVGQGEERRGLSAGPPPYGVPYGGPSSGPSSGPFQQDQAPPEQIIQMRMPPQGPQLYQQPNQNRSRPSLDSQSRPIGQGPPISYHGVSYSDRPRQAGDGSRTHSMTSSTSSQEFHNRRDFSPSAMPQPLHSQNRETLLRGSSLGQEDTPGAGIGSPSSGNIQAPYGNPNIAAAAALADNKDQSELAGKPLPFVRPADIYKRMAEERERERQSQESSRPSMGAITGSRPPLPRDVSPSQSGGRPNLDVAASVPRAQRSFDVGDDSEGVNRGKPQLDSVAERRSEYGLEGMQTSHANPAGDSGSSTAVTPSQPQILASPDQGLLGSPQLPNVPRMSGFGESFMGSIQNGYGDLPDFSREKEQSGDQLKPSVHLSPQEASASPLQHQPSLGYRSVVSKAFEDQQMPSTPTSTSDSAVARSNSESTNAISPIMSRAPSAVSPETRLREAGGRENNVPIIAEESGVGTPRPNSEEPTTTSRPVTRKLSPSSGSPIELSGSQNFATDSGHRRQISSPSPDNSPARTPAFEVNRRFQQPQYAELSVTTPTSMTHTVSTVSNVLPQASNNNAENSASQSQSAIAAESPTSLTSPVVGRADSPSKGRVRNLADRFESRDVSRQGSKSSMRGSTSPQKAGSGDDDLPARPQPDRLESFRPHLPGGWESYISNAPGHPGLPGAAGNRGQASSQKYNEQGNERSMNPMIPEQSFQKMYDDEGPNPRTTDEVPNESMDITPTTEKRALPKAPEEPQSNDAFSAVAAAGAALAGAFTAAVGLDPHHSDESVPDAKPSDFTSARGRSASLKGSDFHPDAIKPWMYQDDDSASSVVPTPLSPLPEQRDKSGNSNYFPPVPPLKQRPFPINVVNETTPSRPQIYPTMSTETSPNDYESDRLRKQLVRELSPATEHFPDDSMARANEPQVEGSALQNSPSTRRQDHDSMFLPQEYDSYWNGSSSGDNVSQRTSHQEAVPQEDSSERQPDEKLPLTTAPQSIAEESYKSVEPKSESVSTNTINTIGASPRQLTHRFSWEPVLEEINAPFQVGTASDVAIATPPHTEGRDDLPKSFTKSQDPPHSTSEITYEDSKEPAKGQTNLQKELPQINDPENQEIVGSSTPIQDYQKPAPEDMPPPHIPNESEMPPFRKIVGIKDGAERIRVYKATREQFAHMRTGLDQWITATINECPEHSDLLNNGGMFGPVSGYKPSPSRGKFPGLRVTSGQQQHVNQNSHMIPPSPNSSALTNSSGYSPGAASGRSSSHQMQVKGKDLLHSAGVFGGRASNATKGLFSKGRNKFKGSSGAEKATPRDLSAHNPNPLEKMQLSYQSHHDGQVPQNRLPISSGRSRPVSSMFTEPHDVPDASNGRVSPLPIKYSRAEGRNSQDQPLRLPDGLSKPGTEANTSPTSSIHNKDARESNGHMSLPSSFEQAMMATYSYDTNMPPITPRNDPRDGMQSPKSAASSNRTPTQADFENGILGRDLPPPPSPLSASKDIISPRPQVRSELPALSRRTSRELPMPSSSGGSAASESPHKSTFVNYGESNTLSILQDKSKLPTTTPERRLLSHLDLGQSNSAAPLRTSEDSEGTFHTADSGAEIQMRPADPAETSHHTNLLAQGNESFSSGHSLNRSMHTPSETTYLPQDTQTSRRSRPFSFISFGQLGAEDLALRGPSMDSDLEKAYNDLPITPVSPLPPMPNQQSHVGPIYHGTNYDFSWDKNQSVGRPRPRSFSRPFQDPILGQHPAFRQDDPRADDADPPGDYYSPQLRRDEAIIPQTTEYQLDGIGPPPPETSTKPRSRQGSRSSAFFKRLSIPPREEVPPIPNAKEQQSMESPSTSPIKPEQKRKRASLFRSLTGHTGSDSSPSRNNSVTPSAKPRTDTQQYASPAPSGREGHRSFTSPPASSNSDKSRSKFQRASMSGVPDQEKGKKKRFSALGSLFGRASPKQQPTPLLTAQPAPLRSPPQRQADVDQRQADTHYRPPGSISHPRQGSAYYTNHQDYSQPSPPAGYDQLPVGYDRPPLEGYYSPDRNSGFLQPGQISRERSPSSAMHTPHHSGSFLQSPSNHAPSLEQPQSAWVPKSMSHSAAPEMQPSTDHRNNNQSLTDPRGHGNFDSPAIVDASQSYQRFQNSQIPPKTRHNQSQSDRSHGISANTARVNAVMSGPRTYHEAPVERRDSPPPPPPPPKDDHLVQTLQSCHGRSSSQSAQSTQHSPSTSRQGVAQARQSLPPLKTNIAQTKSSSNSTPMTPEDIRKARQQQIEQSGRSPQKYVVNSSQPVRDEKIVMSSSSYPGQEWQPDFGHWNGD